MKYRTERTAGFDGFDDLDKMLDDAEVLGTNVIYLVDYWEPDYEHKADYRPKLKWGGDEAFRRGIERVHRRGGRILCYLEATIISRDTELGRTVGPAWALMDRPDTFLSYYNTGDRFYVMYPGRGSGWVDHIVAVAGRLAREFRIDGVHLDSYGVHLDHVRPDHNPRHPDGKDIETFHRGALELVTRMRAELRRHVPDAVVILEGAERTDLLDACDGAQFESLEKLTRKPWNASRRYPIFTSSFSLEEMKSILEAGHNLALSPWWLSKDLGRRSRQGLLDKTGKSNFEMQLAELWRLDNILRANALLPPSPVNFDRLREGIISELNRRQWKGEWDHAPLRTAANRYLAIYDGHAFSLTRNPADAIREMLERAEDSPEKRTAR